MIYHDIIYYTMPLAISYTMSLYTNHKFQLLYVWFGNRIDGAGRNEVPLSDILGIHINQELLSGDEVSIISARRKDLWEDLMRQFLKHSFNPRKHIRVIFHGEEAVDGGGPCTEYFRLLCSSIREQSGVFFTNERLVNFRPNVALFQEHRFHLVGLMIATSIIHG